MGGFMSGFVGRRGRGEKKMIVPLKCDECRE